MPLNTKIAKYWDCLPPPERFAFRTMGVALKDGRPFEFKAVVLAFFMVFSPLWYEKRFNAWLANSTYRVTTVKIDDVDVEVILTSKVIAIQTAACINAGGCPESVTPCLQVTGF